MSLIIKPLSKQDTILVVSPSGKVNKLAMEAAISYLGKQGFKLELGEYVYAKHFKYAGTHEQRLSDLQWALDHPTAKAIFCSRGGYGITHILDQLNWEGFTKYPKWIIGYSDITALHSQLYLNGFQSIHASVLQGVLNNSKKDVEALCNLLIGKAPNIVLPALAINKTGSATSELIGGNLSMLVNQIGTASEISFDHKILFLEEVGENLYHVDRMLLQLQRGDRLKNLSGLIVGAFSDMKESSEQFGQTVEAIILAHCKAYDFPVVFDFPVGHGERNWPIMHGAKVKLLVDSKQTSLTYL